MYNLTAVEAATRAFALHGSYLALDLLHDFVPTDAITLRSLASKQASARLPDVEDKAKEARYCMVNLLVAEQLARDSIGALSEHGDKANFVVNMVNGLLTEVQSAFNILVTLYVAAGNVHTPSIDEFSAIWEIEKEIFVDEEEIVAHLPLAWVRMDAFVNHMSAYGALCEQIDLADEKLTEAQNCAVGLLIAIEAAYAMSQYLSILSPDAAVTVNAEFNKAAQDVAAPIIECLHKHIEYLNNTEYGQNVQEYINRSKEEIPVYNKSNVYYPTIWHI